MLRPHICSLVLDSDLQHVHTNTSHHFLQTIQSFLLPLQFLVSMICNDSTCSTDVRVERSPKLVERCTVCDTYERYMGKPYWGHQNGCHPVGLQQVPVEVVLVVLWKLLSKLLLLKYNIAIYTYGQFLSGKLTSILETKIIGLHFAADNMSSSSLKFLWWYPEILFISARVTFRPFKVIQGRWLWCQSKARIWLYISP